MAKPGPLAPLPDAMSQADAFKAWLDDMAAYQSLRKQMESLQDFIAGQCQ
jgi:hypothetical protein